MLKPNRLVGLEEQGEGVLLALLGYGEARGEGSLGILATMQVALNRAEKWNKPLRDVILQPYQFSCFNHNDPNRDHLLMADKDAPLSWGQCAGLADVVLKRLTIDPTNGATHYYATSIPAPPWARTWQETAVIGHHIFGVAT